MASSQKGTRPSQEGRSRRATRKSRRSPGSGISRMISMVTAGPLDELFHEHVQHPGDPLGDGPIPFHQRHQLMAQGLLEIGRHGFHHRLPQSLLGAEVVEDHGHVEPRRDGNGPQAGAGETEFGESQQGRGQQLFAAVHIGAAGAPGTARG